MRLDPTNRNRVQVKSLLDPGWLETFFSCPVRMYKYQKYKAGICPQRRNHGPAQVPLAGIYKRFQSASPYSLNQRFRRAGLAQESDVKPGILRFGFC